MALLARLRVGKKKPDPDADESKRHTWDQRAPFFQSIALYRDVAEWATEIAMHATREMKRSGAIAGRKQISAARVIDPYVRGELWDILWKIRHEQAGTPNAKVPATPPPPEPALELELPRRPTGTIGAEPQS
jgi:hypothetical protein